MKTISLDAELDELVGGRSTGKELALVGGAFDGADRVNRELALWAPAIISPDQEILPAKAMADARSRDINRNDAYVQHGGQLRKDNIVGSYYMLMAAPEIKVLGLDAKWAEEFVDEVETKFYLYSESEQRWADASRINTLTQMVRLGVGVDVIGGEVLATAEWLRDLGRPYNSAMQMIDADRLSTPWGQIESQGMRAGIERNRYGAPQAYNIRLAHPTDYTDQDAYKWRRVPIRKPWGRLQVLHIFDQGRPDQTRGISAMVAALKEMKVTKKFRDITLQNAVVNATYAASIESELPPEAAFATLGAGNMTDAITQYAGAFLEAIASYAGSTAGAKAFAIDGVRIPHLFPGTKLQLRPAGTPGGVGTTFEASLLRYIAANLGVSYEELSKDYTNTNYSSARAALLQTEKFMVGKKKAVADRIANFSYSLWLEESINKGDITSMPALSTKYPDGWWYQPLMMEALTSCDWIGASSGEIDELKETQAAVLRLNNNLSTHAQEHAKRGRDWRKTFAQISAEKKIMTDLDIVPLSQQAPPAGGALNALTASPTDQPKPKTGNQAQALQEDEDESDRMDELIVSLNGLGVAVEQANRETSRHLSRAVEALAFREDQPPVANVELKPTFHLNVQPPRAGKTRTTVLQTDDKGRILKTETVPVDEEELI